MSNVSRRAWTSGSLALMLGALLAACSVGGPPTPSATASPTASATVAEPAESFPAPPRASLQLADGSVHAGELGSVCYLDACGDSPWLPAAGLQTAGLASAAEPLTVAIEDGFSFVQWSASYAAAEDTTGADVEPLTDGGAEDGPPLGEVSFDAPPSGDWVVSVHLVYANGAGDGTYYWQVIVP